MSIQIEYVSIDSIKPYENNARKHQKEDVQAIVESIKEFGFKDPIGVWNNEIVEGHGRLMAAKELGMTEVPIIRLDDLTDEQRRAYALAHNKTAELSSWYEEILDAELMDIAEIDMSLFGFVYKDDDEQEIIEDEVPENVDSRCKSGDIWKLGDHRLICGDSTVLDDVEKLMDGAKADLFITDPPYNVDYTGKTKDALKIKNDKMDNDSFRQFLRDAFANADCVMRNGAVFYIWHADSEGYNFRGGVQGRQVEGP